VEAHLRSILKAATWRLGGFVVTVLVAWTVTRKVGIAASIGLADTALKLVAYYVHERLWLKVRFGMLRRADYDI